MCFKNSTTKELRGISTEYFFCKNLIACELTFTLTDKNMHLILLLFLIDREDSYLNIYFCEVNTNQYFRK